MVSRTRLAVRRVCALFPCLAAMTALTAMGLSPACGGTLKEDDIVISSAAHEGNFNRVEIQLSDHAVVRVVDEIKQYRRFFIDLYSTEPAFADRVMPVGDAILRGLQTKAYRDSGVLRIVFHTFGDTPFRVSDADTASVFPATPATDTSFAKTRPMARRLVVETSRGPAYPLPELKPAGLRPLRSGDTKRLVVLDPGHGGADPGARSLVTVDGRKIEEKDLVLSVAIEVQRLLNKSPVVSAILTRDNDREMSLDERVAFAEKADGDLFVSVHANSTKYHSNPDARGIEFYYLGETSDPQLRRLEAAENQTDPSALNAKENLHWDLIWKNILKDSLEMQRSYGFQAANDINRAFRQDVYFKIHNRGVKSARFRVLINPVMPSILVEIGYLDHPREVRSLCLPDFQKRIAKLIANGILEHFAQLDSEVVHYQYEMD